MLVVISAAAGAVPTLLASSPPPLVQRPPVSSDGGDLDELLTGVYALVEATAIRNARSEGPHDHRAEVRVGGVVWQSPRPHLPKGEGWEALVAGRRITISGGEPRWHEIEAALEEPGIVYLGLGPAGEADAYWLDYAVRIDGKQVAFLAPGYATEGYDETLPGFAAWQGESLAARPIADLIAGWVQEQDPGQRPARQDDGPIQRAWHRYHEEILYPQPDFWFDRSPGERSLFHAPPSVLREMVYSEVWVWVPDRLAGLPSWRDFEGGLCLRNSEGFADCMMPAELDRSGGHLFPLEAWAVDAEDVAITAHPSDPSFPGVPAEGEGIEAGTIPFRSFARPGPVLVTLPPQGPTSVAELRPGAVPSSAVRAITEEDLILLLEIDTAAEDFGVLGV